MEVQDFLDNSQLNIEDCYFHSFPLEKEKYQDILNSGLKSKILQGKIDHNNSNNGSFYISLFKSTDEKNIISILEDNPLFIIGNSLKVRKTSSTPIYEILTSTFLPLRYSPYNNEYQKFLYLSSKYIIGIRFLLKEENLEKRLLRMQEFMRWEDEIHKNIPYVDKDSCRIINKDKVKKLSLK